MTEVEARMEQERIKKGERFRARKAREAAKRANSQSDRLKSKKPRKKFVQEKPNDDVAAEFEKELAASPLMPNGNPEKDVKSADSSEYSNLVTEALSFAAGANERA